MDVNLANDIYWKLGALLAYSVFEWWLGKTTKTKSGSLLELLANVLRTIFKPKENVKWPD